MINPSEDITWKYGKRTNKVIRGEINEDSVFSVTYDEEEGTSVDTAPLEDEDVSMMSVAGPRVRTTKKLTASQIHSALHDRNLSLFDSTDTFVIDLDSEASSRVVSRRRSTRLDSVQTVIIHGAELLATTVNPGKRGREAAEDQQKPMRSRLRPRKK